MRCRSSIALLRAVMLVILAALPGTARLNAAPQLPETELSWKNVSVDGKKVAVFCILRDSRGLMWMGTNNGLFIYDGAATHAVGRRDLAGSQVHALAEMDGKLYVGSNNGLRIFDFATGTFTDAGKFPPREIRALMPVDKELWIGSLNGLYVLDPARDELKDVSAGLPHRSVYSILRDSRGIVYAGTYSGLARWNGRTRAFEPMEVHGAASGMPRVFFANCLLEDSDHESIYVGTEGALYRYMPAADSWERIPAVDRNNIKSMAHGDHGHILIGTDDGVYDLAGDSARHYRHNSRHELSLADNEIWCIFADADHNIWAGHERGFSIASNSASIRTIKLSDLVNSGEGNDIYSIYRDSRDGLWLTGSNGAIHLASNAAPRWYRHDEGAHPLSHNRIRDIHEDERADMWFATDGGINRFNRSLGTFDVFHVTDSAGEHNSNWVYTIVDDGDSYWLGGFLSGLQRVGKTRFTPGGGTIVADRSLNSESTGARLRNDLVNNVEKDLDGKLWVLLFRDSLISRYDPLTGTSTGFNIRALAGEYPNCMTQDSAGRICCAFSGGVIVIDPDGNHRIVHFPDTGSDESILAMGRVGRGVWVSTQSNVWSVDTETGAATLLPIPQKYYTAIYEDPGRQKVLLGGTDEILEVDLPSMAVDRDFKTINLVLDEHDGRLDLSDLMSGARGIDIPYGGNFTLVVGSLNYSPEAVQRYMYKLTGSDDDGDESGQGWIVMPEGANTITLSDLRMGRHNVLVKILGSDAPPAVIPLTVRPPAALSWWAICLYAAAAAGAVIWLVWFFRRKHTRAFREQERQAALENVERKLSFLSTISHDLKTPLSMILGPVSMLKERTADPASRRSLETVYDNAVRLNNMIHRTIELQRLEDAGDSLLIVSTIDVAEFCRGVFDVFKDNNPAKNFVFHATDAPVYIEADAVKLESVITNLLSNACKYSEDGATISCGIARAGDKVEIVVSDDGLGIAEIDQPLVFQRMFRAPATSKLRDGTGLGLYLIKRYIELMGGTIELHSREGQGTTFVVELPASEQPPDSRLLKEPAADPALPRVLIVEDNQQIADFIAEILDGKYTTLRADNGRTALSIAASFVPDLILADEMMPVMSGLEMVKQLKQNPRLATIPIIMLTAKSDNATESESIKLGIDMFMAKPFEPHALLGRIEQLLKARSEITEKLRIRAIAEAEAKPIEAESVTEKALAKIARTIEENISDPDLNVNMLCEKSDIPNKQLYRLIKKYMGLSPLDYIRSVRLQKAAVLLSQKRFTVAEVSYMVGFKTPSYFAKCFQSQYGVKPSEYHSDDTTM